MTPDDEKFVYRALVGIAVLLTAMFLFIVVQVGSAIISPPKRVTLGVADPRPNLLPGQELPRRTYEEVIAELGQFRCDKCPDRRPRQVDLQPHGANPNQPEAKGPIRTPVYLGDIRNRDLFPPLPPQIQASPR